MEVTLEEAYAEACRIIGENIIAQRMLEKAKGGNESAAERPASN